MFKSSTMVSLVLGASLFASAQARAAADRYIYSQSEGLVRVYSCDINSVTDVAFRAVKQGGNGISILSGLSGKKPVLANGSLVTVVKEGDKNLNYVQVVGLAKDVKPGSNERAAVRLDKGYLEKTSLEDARETVIQLGAKAPDEEIGEQKLSGTFWQIASDDDKYLVFNCGGKNYVAFNVFAAGKAEAIAQIAVRSDETSVFRSMRTLSVEEATRVAGTKPQSSQPTQAQPAPPAQPAPQPALPKLDEVICTQEDGLAVRSDDLEDVLFFADKGETIVRDAQKGKKQRVIEGQSRDYVFGRFENRDAAGWVAAQYVRDRKQCEATGSVTTPPTNTNPSTPAAPVTAGAVVVSTFNPLAASCAREKVLLTAKATVKKIYGNRPNSGGYCATGVRQILVASKVGGLTGGIGNAIDYQRNLKSYGYVETGIRDVTKAPAGSVLVFDGPNTPVYLRNGTMKRPYGNYVGHVAVKGDDGFYYTDGRTAEPAIGWSNDKNVSRIRNLVGVWVPGERLVNEWTGKCANK